MLRLSRQPALAMVMLLSAAIFANSLHVPYQLMSDDVSVGRRPQQSASCDSLAAEVETHTDVIRASIKVKGYVDASATYCWYLTPQSFKITMIWGAAISADGTSTGIWCATSNHATSNDEIFGFVAEGLVPPAKLTVYCSAEDVVLPKDANAAVADCPPTGVAINAPSGSPSFTIVVTAPKATGVRKEAVFYLHLDPATTLVSTWGFSYTELGPGLFALTSTLNIVAGKEVGGIVCEGGKAPATITLRCNPDDTTAPSKPSAPAPSSGSKSSPSKEPAGTVDPKYAVMSGGAVSIKPSAATSTAGKATTTTDTTTEAADTAGTTTSAAAGSTSAVVTGQLGAALPQMPSAGSGMTSAGSTTGSVAPSPGQGITVANANLNLQTATTTSPGRLGGSGSSSSSARSSSACKTPTMVQAIVAMVAFGMMAMR